ncbi:MAG: metallophosphoesterase family protein [Planctomycetota bacterium]|nr:metallophosphoesterase family protein [Planctomycetota bacterium]
MYAIVSDIHANLEALQAVLEDIRRRGLSERIVCLGDLVGYGPNPAECVAECMRFKTCLMGNHDEATVSEALGFNPLAKAAIDWTRSMLKPSLLSRREKKGQWQFISSLPATAELEGWLLVHGSPRDPTMEYILRSDTESFVDEMPPKIKDIFSRFRTLCFVGHTHEPGIITAKSEFLAPADFGGKYDVTDKGKMVINVGSVGQPRDRDNRACYVTFDGRVIEYHRVPYDFNVTARKISAISALDVRIGERLADGR